MSDIAEALRLGLDKQRDIYHQADSMEPVEKPRWYWMWAQNLETSVKQILSALSSSGQGERSCETCSAPNGAECTRRNCSGSPAFDRWEPAAQPASSEYEVGTPRQFAKRLAWMTINGQPDLDQWENHIKYRDAALRSRLAKEV